jgi:hypothetical protein
MPFADHFRKASINKGVLTAECKKADGHTWVPATINLDDYLGTIDGKFGLAPKGNFSKGATDITLTNGVLTAKLRNKAEKVVDAKIDLGTLFHSNDGVITRITTVAAAAASVSAASATAMAASNSATMTSNTSSSKSTTIQTSMSRSSSTFSSSKFRYHSQQLLLEETCSNFHLKGSWLHCDVHHEDGRITCASIDLDLCIGDIDGHLVWDGKGFSKTCTDIKLEGFFLIAKCHNPANHHQFFIVRLDLRTRLRIQGSIIICVETNKKLSMMLSDVPWMKFKVIAEPDLSVFSSHPVVKQTLSRIAESTVEHVTRSMHAMIIQAMETAIVEITASAMKHVSILMEQSVQDAVGYASACASATEAEVLHIGKMGAYGTYGHAHGGHAYGHAHGHSHEHEHEHGHGHEHYGGANGNGNGSPNGGVWAGWTSGAAHGSISRTSSSSASSSVSSSAHSAATGYTATTTSRNGAQMVAAHQ